MDTIGQKFPRTLDKAVERLFSEMSFRDRTMIANMSEARLIDFHKSYGHYIRTEFRLPGNTPLMKSCKAFARIREMTGAQASFIILTALRQRAQGSNVLRVVK